MKISHYPHLLINVNHIAVSITNIVNWSIIKEKINVVQNNPGLPSKWVIIKKCIAAIATVQNIPVVIICQNITFELVFNDLSSFILAKKIHQSSNTNFIGIIISIESKEIMGEKVSAFFPLPINSNSVDRVVNSHFSFG